MSKNIGQTAILVFTRSAHQEVEAKTFSYVVGKRDNRKIARLLNQQILKATQQSGFPTFIFTEQEQTGQNFGEKLANAFENIYAKGFESVIAVGNDCLAVDGKTLAKAKRNLVHQDLIFGPTDQGGVYLIGMKASAYCRKAFLQLSWRTEQLYLGFLNYAKNKGLNADSLKRQREINCPKDLLEVLQDLPIGQVLKSSLLSILNDEYSDHIEWIYSFISQIKATFALLRAPPFPSSTVAF